jgi:hypothetical protein
MPVVVEEYKPDMIVYKKKMGPWTASSFKKNNKTTEYLLNTSVCIGKTSETCTPSKIVAYYNTTSDADYKLKTFKTYDKLPPTTTKTIVSKVWANKIEKLELILESKQNNQNYKKFEITQDGAVNTFSGDKLCYGTDPISCINNTRVTIELNPANNKLTVLTVSPPNQNAKIVSRASPPTDKQQTFTFWRKV